MHDVKRLIIVIMSIVLFLTFAYIFFFVQNDSMNFKADVKKIIKVLEDDCNNKKKLGLVHVSNFSIKSGKLSPEVYLDSVSNINGSIVVNKDCKVSLNLYNDKHRAKEFYTFGGIKVKEKNNTKCYLEDNELKIGSLVRCEDQYFNIINIDDNSVTLFSKYNISLDNNKQDETDLETSSSNSIAFDEFNNREDSNNTYCEKTHYGCNLYSKFDGIFVNGENQGTVSESSTIKYYVDSYALNFDFDDKLLEVGLITIDDLNNLGCSTELKTCKDSINSWVYNTTYWTSSYYSGSPSIVWRVQSDGKLGSSYANYSNNTGIRPVLKISKDILKTSK